MYALRIQKKGVCRRCYFESPSHTDTTPNHETGNHQWKETDR